MENELAKENNTEGSAFKNLIFLDIDGVLNCQLFYETQQFKDYKEAKKSLRKAVKSEQIERLEYYSHQICKDRIRMINGLCEETNSVVVVSSTWRSGKSIEELQQIFDFCGGTFKVIDKTPHDNCRIRGVEIKQWLDANCIKLFGVHSHDFYRYAIIDDDSDMLLWQQDHFFQTDNYSGLTPNTCYRIKRYFTHKTFCAVGVLFSFAFSLNYL